MCWLEVVRDCLLENWYLESIKFPEYLLTGIALVFWQGEVVPLSELNSSHVPRLSPGERRYRVIHDAIIRASSHLGKLRCLLKAYPCALNRSTGKRQPAESARRHDNYKSGVKRLKMSTTSDMFSSLSSNLRVTILSYLDVDDLAEIAQVSTTLRDDCMDERLPQSNTATFHVVQPETDNFLRDRDAALTRAAFEGLIHSASSTLENFPPSKRPRPTKYSVTAVLMESNT